MDQAQLHLPILVNVAINFLVQKSGLNLDSELDVVTSEVKTLDAIEDISDVWGLDNLCLKFDNINELSNQIDQNPRV